LNLRIESVIPAFIHEIEFRPVTIRHVIARIAKRCGVAFLNAR
jgi:hypothetical protein